MFLLFYKHILTRTIREMTSRLFHGLYGGMLSICHHIWNPTPPFVSRIKIPGFSCINLLFFFFYIHITFKMTSIPAAGTRPPVTVTNKVSEFLLDPWSTVKVVVPSAALQVIIHQTCLKKASLRELTLGLTLLNAVWFATTLNMSYIETPLLANVPSLDENQKLDVGRHRFNWINKIEVSIICWGESDAGKINAHSRLLSAY